MPKRQPRNLPDIWIISDARNDAALDRALARLPRGSGLVFRHYHLDTAKRLARWRALRRKAKARGHFAVWSGPVREALRQGADGAYGPSSQLARGPALPRLVTAHSLTELARASRASAILLSPVFATRSHPGAACLGPLRFRLITVRARVPVIALGGMTQHGARRIKHAKWAAIDAFCGEATRRIR